MLMTLVEREMINSIGRDWCAVTNVTSANPLTITGRL